MKDLEKQYIQFLSISPALNYSFDEWKEHIYIGSQEINNIEVNGYKELSGKLSYELDWCFIKQLAERMSQNKHKYEPYNWKKPIDIDSLKQSLFRHVIAVMNDEYEDDNRVLGHLESIALNVMFINYQIKNQ